MDSSTVNASVQEMLQRCIVVPSNEMIQSSSAMSIHTSMISDDMSEPSSPESNGPFDETDLLTQAVHDEVTTQLAAAGPVGVAAAAAIVSGKKHKRPHAFETNPSLRKRQQTRLLRKLKHTLEEYTTRIGQQAAILVATPGKPPNTGPVYKVFGSQPLENIVRNCRAVIMAELEAAIAQRAPEHLDPVPGQYDLPAVCVDGIPTPVDKMTQAQLRQFIPEMLKYSTGRSKPGWGKTEYRPVWWPSDLPWANVRSDVRSEDEKKRVSWTHALRTIVKNCYKHHGREDLMPDFDDSMNGQDLPFSSPTVVQTINNADGSEDPGTVSIIKIETGPNGASVVTLENGEQAQLIHTDGSLFSQGGAVNLTESSSAVQNVLTDSVGSITLPPGALTVPVSMDLGGGDGGHVTTLAEATINASGQIVLSGGDSLTGVGGGDGGAKFGMVIPVSMYQTVVTSLPQLSQSGLTATSRDDHSPYSEVPGV